MFSVNTLNTCNIFVSLILLLCVWKIRYTCIWLVVYFLKPSYTNKQCYGGNTEKCMIIFNRDYLDKNGGNSRFLRTEAEGFRFWMIARASGFNFH